jgi:hypothetical protein
VSRRSRRTALARRNPDAEPIEAAFGREWSWMSFILGLSAGAAAAAWIINGRLLAPPASPPA